MRGVQGRTRCRRRNDRGRGSANSFKWFYSFSFSVCLLCCLHANRMTEQLTGALYCDASRFARGHILASVCSTFIFFILLSVTNAINSEIKSKLTSPDSAKGIGKPKGKDVYVYANGACVFSPVCSLAWMNYLPWLPQVTFISVFTCSVVTTFNPLKANVARCFVCESSQHPANLSVAC